MPTRPYKQRARKREESNAIKEDGHIPKDTSQLPAEHAKHTGAKELDRLLLHISDASWLRDRHCLFPAFNVGREPLNNLGELHLYPSCTISTPNVIYAANRHCERIDICHRRTMARSLFRQRISTCRTRYQTAQKVKKLKTNEKEGTYHPSLFILAQRLECDPDPYFHGSYDYYYTGGNLCLLSDGEHVLHVDGKNLNNLNVGVLPKLRSFGSTYLNPVGSQQLERDDEVFEVRAIENIHAYCTNSFAVRRRNKITLHTLLPSGRMKSLTCFQTNSTPFISFAQSPINSSTFLLTTMKQCIRLYDLNTATPTLTASYEMCGRDDAMRVSWNMVRPWQRETFMFANERKLHIIDTRTVPEQWLKSSCGYETSNYECDFVSAIAKSEFRDLAYVATNHKLHCLDLRYLGVDFESGPAAICHWTHQLEYAPAFMETYRSGANEYIALSSALADDICICELTREHAARMVVEDVVDTDCWGTSPNTSAHARKSKYKSYCLPYQPPTLENAYQRGRVAGKCLQPDADLMARIKRCSTGLAFYDTATFSECIGEDDCATFAMLLTSNSIGDLYARRLIEKDAEVLEEEEEKRCNTASATVEDAMDAYAKRVCELVQPTLNYTEVVNLKAMRNVFRCNTLSKPLNFDEDDNKKADDITVKSRGLGRWRKSIQTLHSYKDALAQDLLSIWDIDYNVDEDTKSLYTHIKRDFGAKPDPETIVSSWLDANIKTEKDASLTSDRLPIIELDSTVMTMVHAPPCDNVNSNSIKIEAPDFLDINNTLSFSEFIDAGPSTQQQSTQLFDAFKQLPNSPTEQEEFISLVPKAKPQSKPAKKKSKYVKGF